VARSASPAWPNALAAQLGWRLTVVHKANVLRVTDGLWRETCLAVGREFPGVTTDEGLVDSVPTTWYASRTATRCF